MISWVVWPLRSLVIALRNLRRRLGRAPDFVLILIEAEGPELPEPRPRLWQRLAGMRRPASMLELGSDLRRLAADPRVQGVVLHLRPLDLTPARTETLRGLLLGLRQAQKRVLVYSSGYTSSTYRVACAADQILLLPGGEVGPLGVSHEYRYLADGLARIGLQAQFERVSPFKSAPDRLGRSSMSDEVREMSGWLADAAFGELRSDLASGRGLDQDRVAELIERSPLTDQEALDLGAVDHVMSEEQIARHLGRTIVPWARARSRIRLPRPPRPGPSVALVRVQGAIVDGRSSRAPLRPPLQVPMLLDARAGDLSVIEAVRRAARSRRVAALVLWVDSPGGSSTASEAMASALEELARRKPLVAAVGAMAASGGYYVMTPARAAFAQPGSLTGSIGVYSGKIVNAGLFDLLSVGRELVQRGSGMSVMTPARPWTDSERARVRSGIDRVYDLFLNRVAGFRQRSREDILPLAGGRVFSGRQALERGLIDQLGGLEQAIQKARELAGLRADAPVREIHPRGEVSALAPGSSVLDRLLHALETAELLNRAACLTMTELL